jgi:putative SOS response-associated peptidase YedK
MADYLETRFNAKFIDSETFEPIYHSSAFKTPHLPIISNEAPDKIQFFQWGLIPFWVKDREKARKISFNTFNAKSETIFEKPSFRTSIKTKRCLVIVDGFYEWKHLKGDKFPYYIKLANSEAFAMAGIWDTWENKQSGEQKNTFSIITTSANKLLEEIHNTKKRMPVILKREDEKKWLEPDLDIKQIKAMLTPYDDSELEAYSVSKLITKKGQNSNVPEVLKKHEYDGLKQKQSSWF